jgi:hypothetical protein
LERLVREVGREKGELVRGTASPRVSQRRRERRLEDTKAVDVAERMEGQLDRLKAGSLSKKKSATSSACEEEKNALCRARRTSTHLKSIPPSMKSATIAMIAGQIPTMEPG